MGKLKIALTLGTRPEIIKLSKIAKILKKNNEIETKIIHTGQHYSYLMNQKFIEEMNFPKIDFNLEVGSWSHAYQVANMLLKFEEVFLKEEFDVVVAEGDTNSTFASCLAATKAGIPFAHVEAGIRSFDRNMPEEINRILTDQISDYLFAPTNIAVENLKNSEARKESIYLTGNPIVEVTRENLKKAKRSQILKKLDIQKEEYVVLTLHREENTKVLNRLLEVFKAIKSFDEQIIFPIHPRTKKVLSQKNLWRKVNAIKNIKIIDPLGYLDFLSLCANSKFIMTDSGGIQEECTIYKKPVLILRDNTERPEILGRWGWLTGCRKNVIIARYKWLKTNYHKVLERINKMKTTFGDGHASERIVKILLSTLN